MEPSEDVIVSGILELISPNNPNENSLREMQVEINGHRYIFVKARGELRVKEGEGSVDAAVNKCEQEEHIFESKHC